MQFSKAVLLSVFAAIVGAQDASSLVGQVPSCANACLAKAAQAQGCDVTDFACQCTGATRQAITADATPCVLQACSVKEALKVQTVTGEICNTATNGASDDDSDEEAESPTTAAPASPTAGNVVVATTECVTTSTIHANGSAPTATSSAAPEEFTGAAGSVRVAAGMLFGAGAAVAAAIL